MNYSKLFIMLLAGIICSGFTCHSETITFTSKDGVKITADNYQVHPDTVPLILLFHQAGWSRGEYTEIAPRLNRMGYNCLAVDLRSGNRVNNIENQTFLDAKGKMKDTNYISAEMDIESSIEFAKKFTQGPVILWGSSYSASLVLKSASLNNDRIQAVIAFSPGEYFRPYGKPSDYIRQCALDITVPAFVTCAKAEKTLTEEIFKAIPGENKLFFVPETSGHHGSSALWNIHFDSKGYWESLESFLRSL